MAAQGAWLIWLSVIWSIWTLRNGNIFKNDECAVERYQIQILDVDQKKDEGNRGCVFVCVVYRPNIWIKPAAINTFMQGNVLWFIHDHVTLLSGSAIAHDL